MADADYTNEKWLPVVGYPDYEVSDMGRIRSLARVKDHPCGVRRRYQERVLKQQATRLGHMSIRIVNEDGPKTHLVHRLILGAFVGPCPDGMEACHWDDDPANNLLSNLRWDTRSANRLDMVRNGRNHHANKTHCKWGHEFTAENTQILATGHRRCRECESNIRRRRRERRRAERLAGDR